MTLFESLKIFPKVDLHIDFLGSIPKEAIYKLTNDENAEEIIDSMLELDSIKNYDNAKNLVATLLNNLDNLELAATSLIQKLKNDNLIYGEIFLNLDLFLKSLKKEDIIKTILKVIKKSDLDLNIVL